MMALYKLPRVLVLILSSVDNDEYTCRTSDASESIPYGNKLHLLQQSLIGRILRCKRILLPNQGDELWELHESAATLSVASLKCVYKAKMKLVGATENPVEVDAVITACTQIVLESRWAMAFPVQMDTFQIALQDQRVVAELIGIVNTLFQGSGKHTKTTPDSIKTINEGPHLASISIFLIGACSSGKSSLARYLSSQYRASVTCLRMGELMARFYDEDATSPAELLMEAFRTVIVSGLPAILLLDDVDNLAARSATSPYEEEIVKVTSFSSPVSSFLLCTTHDMRS